MSDRQVSTAPPRVWPIKLVTVAILIALLWPVPGMVTFSNPDEAAVLGRYTLKYFALMLVYLGGVAVWAGLTGWLVFRLSRSQLIRLRGFTKERLYLLPGILIVSSCALFAFQAAIREGLIGFPSGVHEIMEALPYLLFLLSIILILLIAGQTLREGDSHQASPHIVTRFVSPIRDRYPWIGQIATAKRSIIVALVGICLIFVVVLLRQGIWSYPLNSDAGVQIYLSQRLYAGSLPYQAYLHFQPPGYPASVWLWAFFADLTSLPIVYVARGFAVLLGMGILVIVYESGRLLTHSAAGGLLAAVILLTVGPLTNIVLQPHFKVVVVFVCYLGILLAQKKRWFWAGILAGWTVATWIPGASFGISVFASLFFTEKEERRRAFIHFLTGVALIISITIGALALLGVLDDAYKYAIRGTWLYLTDSGGGEAANSILTGFVNFINLANTNLADGPLLTLFCVVGFFLLIWQQRKKKILASLPLIVLSPLLVIELTLDSQGAGDILILTPLMALLAAWLYVMAMGRIKQYSAFYAAVLCAILLFSQTADVVLGTPPPISLAEQQAVANEINALLEPDQTVQVIGDLWFLVLTERPNATRFAWLTKKTPALLAAEGHTTADVLREFKEANPSIVMCGSTTQDDVTQWLDQNYTDLGEIYRRHIYVRNDETALIDRLSSYVEQSSIHGSAQP